MCYTVYVHNLMGVCPSAGCRNADYFRCHEGNSLTANELQGGFSLLSAAAAAFLPSNVYDPNRLQGGRCMVCQTFVLQTCSSRGIRYAGPSISYPGGE